jgi:uncharacterized protein YkwD/uncharacterized membrane protein required for colicin V production
MSWVDLVAGLALFWLAVAGFRNGLAAGLLSLAANAAARWAAMQLTPAVAQTAREYVELPGPLAEPLVFALLLIVGLGTGGALASAAVGAIHAILRHAPLLAALDRVLGPVPSVAMGVVMLAAVSLAIAAAPFDLGIRDDLNASVWGRQIMPHFAALAPEVDEVVRKLPAPTVPTFAPGEHVGETGELPIPGDLQLREDAADERRMLELVNAERQTAGLQPLTLDPAITAVARAHSRAMFEQRFFAHTDPGGHSPFDRMSRGGVRFRTAGENLAYAPSVEQAHTGLMNSPGHRANILRPEFRRIGIGVIASDGYGRMYTQNFAD